MRDHSEELEIAKNYLTEMLEADRIGDYEAFTRHFESADLEGFDESVFLKDVEAMREDLGVYERRSFLGSLKGFQSGEHSNSVRFVWRATYEKNEALIIVGIHEKNGAWYVHESVVSK